MSAPRWAVLVALLAIAGCSGSAKPAARATAEPVSSPTAVTTTAPAVTASPTPSATASPTPSPQPTRPVKVPAADGDVDGDGKPDLVSVAPVAASQGVWTVTLRLTALGTRRGQVHAEGERPRVAGVVDADGDGYGEVFLAVDQGASTSFWAVLRLVNGVVREVTSEGQPLHLGVGGTVTHGDGFACRDDIPANRGRELVVYSGDSFDGSTWEGTVTDYAWVGGTVRQLRSRDESFPFDASGSDPRLAPYYDADCGSLNAQGG